MTEQLLEELAEQRRVRSERRQLWGSLLFLVAAATWASWQADPYTRARRRAKL